MKILLTNDDGWDAPGLKTLQSVAAKWGEIWTLAPLNPMSGISHQTTFERPLTLTEQTPRCFSLDGTPADCVRIATTQLGIDFDWVLSGINHGGNLGADIYVSGTVAAAREATLRGVRSIALSQHRMAFDGTDEMDGAEGTKGTKGTDIANGANGENGTNGEFDWTRTRWMAEQTLDRFLPEPEKIPSRTAININFPDRYHSTRTRTAVSSDPKQRNPTDQESNRRRFLETVESVDCELDSHPLPADFKIDDQGRYVYCSQYNQRSRDVDGDVAVCLQGAIAISVLKF